MQIIGITGTLGAGKGTIVEYLVKHHGFKHYSVRGFLLEIIKERNLPPNRDSMVKVGNELRAKHTPSYIVEQIYNQAKTADVDCIIESIRTMGEVEALKGKENFTLFAINANADIRYKRITERASETDKVSFEKFLEEEEREMISQDPNKQNLSACMAAADYYIENNSTIEELNQKLEGILYELKNSY